ncbi:ankyrin repeat domain-containing protein [Nocardia spumae]|uniref:ankyrin repeat domain-containing protein n=1 Tax=Nocardia spumae TaxID=2887190 RepID=UPI001D140D87|nr:ankyrin repeat domain-containing protein [Nocardia spumae]
MDTDGVDPGVVELATRMFESARNGAAATLAAYIDAGVPVNLANDKGDTLLMLAAYHGHLTAVTALLERGADPDRANDRGQTPAAGAVFKGEDDILQALLAAGADPDAGTPSARESATVFGRTELLNLFDRG